MHSFCTEAVVWRCSIEKVVLKVLQNSLSCEFSEIFKNAFFTEHLLPTASISSN